jgi:hypothetical protein
MVPCYVYMCIQVSETFESQLAAVKVISTQGGGVIEGTSEDRVKLPKFYGSAS